MKRLFFLVLIMGVFLTAESEAQDCTMYFPSKQGSMLVYQYYDAKGKPTSRMTYQVMKTEQTEQGLKIRTREWVETPEHPATDTVLLDFYCRGDSFYIDMRAYLSQLGLDKYKGMDIKVETKNIELPAHPKAGMSLPDASVVAVVTNNGVKLITVSSYLRNRKIEGFEKVTTPAGTYNCFKVTYDLEGKAGFVRTHGKSIVWYTRDIGTVKSENFNKKGKLTSKSELIKVL